MLDIHAAALSSVDEGYHNFLLCFKSNSKVVYGFVEGKDDPSFYKSMIDRFIPDDWQVRLLISGNKKKSVKTYQSFDWDRFDPRRVAFFLDRDTDDFVKAYRPNEMNIYYTDGYSIENSIVTREVFSRLLSEAYGVVDAEEEERTVLFSFFDREIQKIEDTLAPVMAQIIAWRMAGSTAYLNDADLGDIFHFENGSLCLRNGLQDDNALVQRYANLIGAAITDPVERREIEKLFRRFSRNNSLVRGKFLFWFLAAILNYTHANISAYVGAYQRPPRARQPLGPKNIGFSAAPRARIPASLRSFINETYLAFISNEPELIA